MKNIYKPFKNFVLRTPLFSFNHLKERDIVINSAEFQEAILLASPDLYKIQDTNPTGKKEEKLGISLNKYFIRACTRCTPFGLFAGCSTGEISDNPGIELVALPEYKRVTRLDMQYLCALIKEIEKDDTIKKQLLYYPNDSAYPLGGKLRYIEYKYRGIKRIHQIISLELSDCIEKVLISASHGGAYIDILANSIIDDDITFDDASAFIEDMIDAQILKSNIDPSVVGEDILTNLINKLSKLEDIPILPDLIEINNLLREIDNRSIGTSADIYDKVISIINRIGVDCEERYLFQTDMFKPVKKAVLSKEIVNDINELIFFLSQINTIYKNDHLDAFKEEFYKKFENMEIPLSKALDRELGIGYPKSQDKGDVNILIDDLFLPVEVNPRQQISSSSIDMLLLRKLVEAEQKGADVIVLEDSDLSEIHKMNADLFPQTISVVCSIISDSRYNRQIYLKSVGGICGANLLGRFCHIDDSIMNLVQDIADNEKASNPDVIYAELSHLPESRIGNIASRPLFRDYVLHYLSNSDEPYDKNIMIDDLMVSIKNGHIFIRSRKHNREVVPRLTCAHNYSYSPIPAYRFLSDIQNQNMYRGLGVSWGSVFSNMERLPRITYKNIILARRKWRIKKNEINDYHNMNDEQLIASFSSLAQKKHMSRYLTYAEYDNEIFIDIENVEYLRLLLSLVKKEEIFALEEFVFSNFESIVKEGDLNFANEIILAYHK